MDFGQRCDQAGTISHATKGEGPWFCRFHFFGQSLPKTAAPMPDHIRDLLPKTLREPGADEGEERAA